jgi:hypothetical protein
MKPQNRSIPAATSRDAAGANVEDAPDPQKRFGWASGQNNMVD